jgi:hypothetical protein
MPGPEETKRVHAAGFLFTLHYHGSGSWAAYRVGNMRHLGYVVETKSGTVAAFDRLGDRLMGAPTMEGALAFLYGWFLGGAGERNVQ